MAWDPTLTALRNVLAEIYNDPHSARRIADDASLDSSLVQGSARDGWHALLKEADAHGRVAHLIELATAEYPEHVDLARAATAYQVAHRSGAAAHGADAGVGIGGNGDPAPTVDPMTWRDAWLDALSRLLDAQFGEIVFRLSDRVKDGQISSGTAPLSTRASELLKALSLHADGAQRLAQAWQRVTGAPPPVAAISRRADPTPAPRQPEESAPDHGAAVVVLTALGLEHKAVAAHLKDLREDELPTGTLVEVGTFAAKSRVVRVGLVEMGAGNSAAAAISQEVISHYRPEMVLVVGVAGGIKDVRIGDVVVATKVYGYEAGKAAAEFLPRPDVGQSSYRLIQRARAEARRTGWLIRLGLATEDAAAPRAFIAPIAAGNAVVSSTKSAIFKFLRSNYGDALAVEMEGRGFLEAAYHNRSEALVVRGISDLIDKKSEADAGGSQPLAARNAAAFAFEVIANVM